MRKGAVERFWLKVEKTPTCWLWTAAMRRGKYGAFWDGESLVTAHRFSWSLVHGKIPDGLFVLHSCDVPACVNPAHLRVGDGAENILEAALKGRMKNPGRPGLRAKALIRRPHVARLYKLLGTQEAVAEVLGVSRGRVAQLLRERLP